MNIANIAFIDWGGRNQFSLSKYLVELDETIQDSLLDASEHAQAHPRSPNRLDNHDDLVDERAKNRMPLTIVIDLRKGFSPRVHEVDYQVVDNSENRIAPRFTWITEPIGRLPDTGTKHELFRILEQLARHTNDSVKACVWHRKEQNRNTHEFHRVEVSFFVREDIRQPTRYLRALANNMAKWAVRPTR